MNVNLKSEATERPGRRISIALPVGVHEALTQLARRSGLRPSEVARDALQRYEPLHEECRRVDEVQS